MRYIRIITGALPVMAFAIPAAASASTWHYRMMNRGARIGFVSDNMKKPNHVIGGVTKVCPRDRGAVAVKGRVQYGLYFSDCPVAYYTGKPEYQGADIFARKRQPGAWRPLTAGTSPFEGNYFGAPKSVVLKLERMLGNHNRLRAQSMRKLLFPSRRDAAWATSPTSAKILRSSSRGLEPRV